MQATPLGIEGMPHTDEWIINRIRWAAGKHGIPRGNTNYFEACDELAMSEVIQIASRYDCGDVVLMCFDTPLRWTALCTRAALGVVGESQLITRYEEIESISSRDYPPTGYQHMSETAIGRLKTSWEYLSVADQSGGVRDFWVPPGAEAFAVWNALLMLARLTDNQPQ